ncbi:MAG: hypothetical protein F6K19_24475, partial [Cyanothece sp. SIO1E1]|nr:hypothetical protein [Cyanothece sp. SIO1E1]
MSTFKHLRAIALLPDMVTLVIPGLILYLSEATALDQFLSWVNLMTLIWGLGCISLGLTLGFKTVTLFAIQGQG